MSDSSLSNDQTPPQTGVVCDQKRPKRKYKKKRPLDERMFESLSQQCKGSSKATFLNALTAQVVIFSVQCNYSKQDLITRVADMYTFVEQEHGKQSR